jgi:hypothetical protein
MLNLAVGIMMFVSSVAPTQATSTGTSSAPISTSTPKVVSVTKVETELNKTTEDLVREEFSDIPIMVEIAKCESQFTQFNKDGSIHLGRINPADVGTFQINERYHLRESQKLNLDIHTVNGNLKYARHLYESEGVDPWSASSPCWGKRIVVARK